MKQLKIVTKQQAYRQRTAPAAFINIYKQFLLSAASKKVKVFITDCKEQLQIMRKSYSACDPQWKIENWKSVRN